MGRSKISSAAWLSGFFWIALFGGASQSALGGLIAGDSYAIGASDPSLGQYAAGVALRSQSSNLTTPGFAVGPYNQGSGTVNFQASSGGLNYPPFGVPAATDGKVTWIGAATDGATRSVGRLLNPAAASSSTYWFNILVSQDGTTAPGSNGYVLSGFGNTVPPLLGATAGNNEGLFFGFAQHGTPGDTGDLVIRYRSGTSLTSDAILVDGSKTNTAQVYNIVARLDVNFSGATDYLTYWVNPTNYSSQAALDSSSLVTNDTPAGPAGSLATLALQSSSDFQRLTYSATNWTGRANFDEVRLGTTLADVVPGGAMTAVPEPASFCLVAIGLVGGLGARIRRRARDRGIDPALGRSERPVDGLGHPSA